MTLTVFRSAFFLRREVDLPVEVRSHGLQLGDRHDVVDIGWIAAVDAGHRSFGQRGLYRHHIFGFCGCLFGRIAEQREHLRHMREVFGAERLRAVILIQVVIAVGQAEAALVDRSDLLGGVLLVLLGAEGEEKSDGVFVFHGAEQGGQRLLVVPGGDGLERWLDRLRAEAVGQVRVHAGGKVVAVLLLQRGLGGVGGSLQLLVEEIVVALGQFVEPTPPGLVRRDGIVLLPVAAGVLVEVGAGIDGLIDG